MDERRFDGMVRAFGAGMTRRAGLRALLGTIAAGIARGAEASGRKQPGAAGPCGPTAKENRCDRNGDCCTKYCADGTCRCKPNWMECNKSDHCCSGSCVGGRCDGGCKSEGSKCAEQFNCCDGLICANGICTVSNKAKCGKSNCAGCCDGTSCRTGASATACGAKGGACVRCAAGQTCQAGVCKGGGGCSAATCASGCCDNGVCKPGTAIGACGTGGAACSACGGGTPNCTNQQCAAGSWTSVAAFGSSSSFNGPTGIAVTSDGLKALVADPGNYRVAVWTCSDAASTSWSESTTFGSISSFGGPYGVATPADGLAAYISDNGMDRAAVWTDSSGWSEQTTFGFAFVDVKGIAVSPDQLTVWVTACDNDTVMQWSRPDTSSTSWSQDTSFGGFGTGGNTTSLDKFDNPTGIALSGDLLTSIVADRSNDRVTVWTRSDTQKTSTWTAQAGFGANEFDSPHAVALSPNGLTAYVADYNHFKIQVWNRPDAASTSWAYLTEFGAWGDGTKLGDIQYPMGVAVSADGLTAWVVDSNLNRVTVWTYA